jgi:hypothetical protein
MRFSAHKHVQQKVRAAQHIKIPYASERLDIIQTEYRTYNNIHNILYQASSDKHVTYFFIKNNHIYYHKERENISVIFKLDILYGNHRVLDTSYLEHNFKDADSILVEMKDGKRYIITNNVDWVGIQECVAVMDANNGNNLYIESKQNKLYLEAFLPIANSVIPIVQVTKEQINIHMIDVTTERPDIISWSIGDIKDLISLIISQSNVYDKIKEIILKDNLTQIDKFSAKIPDFVYRLDNKGNVHLKAIKLNFDMSLSGIAASYDLIEMQIRIEWDGNRITCFWSTKSKYSYLIAKIKEASVRKILPNIPRYLQYLINNQIAKSGIVKISNIIYSHAREIVKISNIIYPHAREIVKISNRIYPHPVVTKDIYLSNILYSNICGCLLSSNRGLSIITSRSRIVHYYNEAVVHKYKEYIIIVANLLTYDKGKMKRILIIDTKNELMGIWEINKTEWDCESESIMYNHYYFKDDQKLIFISSTYDSICMFYVDTDKMSNILKVQKELNCEVQRYESIKDVVKSYDIKKLIIKAIIGYHGKKPREDSVQIIGHYVDENASKIYVVSKYILSEGKSVPETAIRIYTSLFTGTIREEMLTFDLCYYIVGAMKFSYKASSLSKICVTSRQNGKLPDLLKIDLYNSNYSYRQDFKHSKAKDLDLVYDNNMFVSLKYYRRSYRIIKGNQHIIHTNMSAIGSLLSVEYKYSSSEGIKQKNLWLL